MGRLFDRFTNDSSQKSMFHSSGLTDPQSRQIGGGVTRRSFRQRMAIRRTRIGAYEDAQVIHGYRQQWREDKVAQRAKQEEQESNQPTPAANSPKPQTPAPGDRTSPPSGARRSFTEPRKASRDPFRY